MTIRDSDLLFWATL